MNGEDLHASQFLAGNGTTPMAIERTIDLEGVRVHNLKGISLKLPLDRLIVISGVSGSGKSSLAFDTLYTEGRRRYIESFSAYARQFLERLEKPDAERIDNIPPAIAIRQNSVSLNSKSTIGTATEINDYLRLLFTSLGTITCPDCEQPVECETPSSIALALNALSDGTRFQIGFEVKLAEPGEDTDEDSTTINDLQQDGFTRAIVAGTTRDLGDFDTERVPGSPTICVIVDRLVAGQVDEGRLFDSLELAFRQGDECCVVLIQGQDALGRAFAESIEIDGHAWMAHRFSGRFVCNQCAREFPALEPRLFSFNTPMGACPVCHGFGAVPSISLEKLVPDPSKTLREGAIAAWTTPAYRHELDELLELADDYGIPVDLSFADIEPQHLELITQGVPERNFGGLVGFFDWLERHRYKKSVGVFLSRWRAYERCASCAGTRLQSDALAVRIGGRNIAELCGQTVNDCAAFFERFESGLSAMQRDVATTVIGEICSRLGYLAEVGLDYLTLGRTMRTLSGGEAQRVALTAALGSSLVNTLYVLDEPSIGLHPRDSQRVIDAIKNLRSLGNTVVVVEHEEEFLRAADWLIDVGPGAGRSGGRIVFEGPPQQITKAEGSETGAYLSGRKTPPARAAGTRLGHPHRLKLSGARIHNLKNLTVEFPLSGLCVVTGVSGSGKSTLVEETLYPALCRELGQPHDKPTLGVFDGLEGIEHIDEVVLADQSPIGRTPRSIPVTYLKVFDEIRKVFAATQEAKIRNFKPAQFSFNASGGGRCPKCTGSGSIEIEMQFLADVSMTCPECQGTRFRREVLDAKYRGLSIADVLDTTVGEAFTFFRTHPRIQKRLNFLKDVGLDYLPLGQPATTLSGGESQRMKLASFLASGTRSRTLFLIDEPTVGLHTADVAKLLTCFESLIGVGHSLIVVEHNLDVIRAADHVIDLGPGAGAAGGEVVATGTPEQIEESEASITAEFLRGHRNATRSN